MTVQRPDEGTNAGRTPEPPEAPFSRDLDRNRTPAGLGQPPVGAEQPGHGESAALRARRTGHRPQVRPLPPGSSERCLCGDPAESVVDTYWFNGRHSRDPVCRRHVTEVVAAITGRQARRDGR